VNENRERPSWAAKPRLPTEPAMTSAGGPGARAAVLVIYTLAFFAMAGAAAFMGFMRGFALTQPEVLVPMMGALWFLVRIIMVARPRL
jgi:hypothetical protein